MGILSRLFRIGKSEAHAIVDKIEDPTKISQQILRDLKENLSEAITGTAEVKAMAAQHRAAELDCNKKASEWESKANQVLDRVDRGQIDETEGNALAADCLKNQQAQLQQAAQEKELADKNEKAASILEDKTKQIRQRIEETENKAKMIASRAKTADVEEKINKTLSSVDTDGLMSTLERMEEKTKAAEFRAAAFAEVDELGSSTSSKVDKLLKETSPNDALEALKAKRKADKS